MMIIPKGFKIGFDHQPEKFNWYIYVNDDNHHTKYKNGTIVIAEQKHPDIEENRLVYYDDIIDLFDLKKLKAFDVREEKLKRILKDI